MSGLAHFVRDRRRRLHRHRSDSVRDDGTEEDLYHQSLVVDWRRWNDNDDIDDDAVHASAAANDVQKRIVAPAVTASPWRDRQKQDISFFLAQRFGIHPVDDDDDDRNNDNDDDKDSDCDQTGSGACGETKPETVAFAGDAPQPSNPENDDDDDGCLTQQQRQEAPLPTTRPCSNSRRRSTKRQRTKTPFLVVKKPHRDSFLNTALLQFPSYIPAISSLTAAATTTTTTHLSELDLFAPQVDVALCRVQLYWDARETKRMTTSTSRFAPYDFDVRHYQTDGPLVTLYNPNPSQKKTNNNHCKPLDCPIVSLEVEQCRDDPWMTERLVRQTAKPIHGATHRRAVSTTALFLYQAYGRAMHGVLERVRQLQKNSVTARGTNHGNNTAPKAASAAATPDVNLYLSLSGVPSWSVLPLAAVDWYDADVATRYCLCIGDESSLSIIVNDDDDDESTRVEEPVMSKTTSNVSFDHPLLTVGCLIVDDSTGTPLAEYRLTASPSQGAVLVPVPEAGSIHTNKNNNTSLILQQSYQRYFQSKHNSNRGTQEGFAQSTTALLEDGTATTSPTLTAERVDEVNRPEAAVLGVDKQSTASAETGMEVGHLHPVYETENSTVLVLNDTSKNVGTQAQQDDCSYEQLVRRVVRSVLSLNVLLLKEQCLIS